MLLAWKTKYIRFFQTTLWPLEYWIESRPLEWRNQYHAYLEAKERSNKIGKIEVPTSEYKNYIWLPYRPVFKEGEQSTIKITPVFNCSLKNQKCYFAAYPGINLKKDLLKLLLLFRSHKCLLLGDIRQAFLRITLPSEEDKNRFFFFLKGNQLLCYHYWSFIF